MALDTVRRPCRGGRRTERAVRLDGLPILKDRPSAEHRCGDP
jgi:hypothetical protein